MTKENSISLLSTVVELMCYKQETRFRAVVMCPVLFCERTVQSFAYFFFNQATKLLWLALYLYTILIIYILCFTFNINVSFTLCKYSNNITILTWSLIRSWRLCDLPRARFQPGTFIRLNLLEFGWCLCPLSRLVGLKSSNC